MRIRSIKPEFWRSDDISSLPWDDRLIFVGLWSYVDDNGVGVDKLSSIAADLFAGDIERDPSETFARVSRGLQNLFSSGRIDRYTVGNKKYLAVVNWDRHQRIDKPNKPRFPLPDCDLPVIRETLARVTEKVAPGTEEQRNRGTEEQRLSTLSVSDARAADVTAAFDDAYSHWPKKTERKQALEKFKVAAKKISLDDLAAYVFQFGDAYAATTTTQYTPALGAWLGRERWTDELPTMPQADRKPTRTDQNLDFVAQLAREEAQEQRGITA